MDKLKDLAEYLRTLREYRLVKHTAFVIISYVIEAMAEAGEGNTRLSLPGIDINITKDTIDLINDMTGETIATLKLELKNV